MTNEAQVYFALKGEDFDPDEFTQWTGLCPTDVLRKCAPQRYGNGTYSLGMWFFSSGWHKSDVLVVHDIVDGFAERLEGHADMIASAVADQDVYAVLEVVLHVSTEKGVSMPALGSSTKTVAFLNRVGAEIDVDLYRGERSPSGEPSDAP